MNSVTSFLDASCAFFHCYAYFASVAVLCEMKLSMYDTVAYMSISDFLILMPFLFLSNPTPRPPTIMAELEHYPTRPAKSPH